MSQTRVVNCRKEKYGIYIGRRHNNHHHYGNPFSHNPGSGLSIRVSSREEAIQAFREWITGTGYQEVEPDRRLWILANLKELRGKILGCWCKPLACHGDVLVELADEVVG